jgi:FkbH-like protein
MSVIRSSLYLHVIELDDGRALLVHALSQLRLSVDAQVAGFVRWFQTPREMPREMPDLPGRDGLGDDTLARCLAFLVEAGVLTTDDPAAETAAAAARLGDLHGRDPGEALDRWRREAKTGAEPIWAVTKTRSLHDLGRQAKRRIDVLLLGDCDLQMEADFLVEAGLAFDIDVRVATAFPDDPRIAGERAHDVIIVGALRSRREMLDGGEPGIAAYRQEAEALIAGLRAHSSAPILLGNLPEPTLQPLGMADRGAGGHRNRFRRLNLELDALADASDGVHGVDVAAAIAFEGARRLVDDGLVGFTHFGAPGWMLQRPADELRAVHGRFPDLEPLRQELGGDPYARERVLAKAHMDAMVTVLGIGRIKCVIVDLDDTLWPGVLAETGAPFAWTPEIIGASSYIGLYFGLHEALKRLKSRGVVLACVSKNDEALVRDLWRYPDGYPLDRLLTPDDFVTWRVNWTDKPANIASLVEELGFAEDAFAFVDDNPLERDRVKAAFPNLWVLGEDPFALRRQLLTDPRLQTARITGEGAARTELVKGQLQRGRLKRAAHDEAAFLGSLDVRHDFAQPTEADGDALLRVQELFERTTQFNTTGRRFTSGELAQRAAAGEVFTATVSDRFGAYGLAMAAVTEGGEIVAFAMSCRIIGLKVEQPFLAYILAKLATRVDEAYGRIIETERNGPARRLFADGGFVLSEGVWRKPLRDAAPLSAVA